MKVLDRYLLRETARSLAALVTLLFLVTVGLYLGETLTEIASGAVPADLLLNLLALKSLEALSILLPLAMFLATVLTLGRLYRDSEMVVMSACGYGRVRTIAPVARLAVPLAVLLLVHGLWVSPWADRTAREQIAQASADVSVAGLQPGRFQPIAARNSVFYVEALDREGRFRNAFVHMDRGGRKDIVTARRGYQTVDPATGARYVVLLDGLRSEGVPGEADFRMVSFARNDIRLPDPPEVEARLKLSALTLAELVAAGGPAEWGELHWRLAPCLATLALAALAVPLARTRPREGYYGNLVLAVLAYVAYFNLLALGRAWLEADQLPRALGLWWLPFATLLLAAGLLRPGMRRPRAAAA